jgi:glycosyltransferase involved in cell wall biosynthesis
MWLAECTFVASWLARLNRTKHIASICGQDALASNPYLKHLRFEKMIVTAASANAARAFSESTGRSVDHIIPTGLDREARAGGRSVEHRSIDILGVGSLIPVKNFRLFLEIIAKLKGQFPQLRCMILGDGAERPALERQIQDNALSEVVQLAGQVPREQVLDTMRRAKILLHTATYEGQGYVFLEALAAGMRVVSFDVGYTGNGPSVDLCRSEEEILGVLKTLLARPFDPEEVQVDCIEETARAFEELYGITQS